MAFKFDSEGLLQRPYSQPQQKEKKRLGRPPKNPSLSSNRNYITNNSYSSTTNTSYIQAPPDEVVSAALGGDIGNALQEIKGVLATPFNYVKEQLEKRKQKVLTQRRDKTIKDIYTQNRASTNKLDEIKQEIKTSSKRTRGKDKKPRKRRGTLPKDVIERNDSLSDINKRTRNTNKLLEIISKNSGSNGKTNKQSNKSSIGGLGKAMSLRMFSKGLGVIGAVVGAFNGVKDYKKLFGLSSTTLSQKLAAGVGGIINGISDTLKFFTGGQVELIKDKDFVYKKLEQIRVLAIKNIDEMLSDHPQLKTIVHSIGSKINSIAETAGDLLHEMYLSVTTDDINMPTMKKLITSVRNKYHELIDGTTESFNHVVGSAVDGARNLWNSLTIKTDKLRDELENLRDDFMDKVTGMVSSAKRAMGFKTDTEKEYEKVRDKKEVIEDEILAGKKWNESYEEYTKRMKVLNSSLLKAKEDEALVAKKALKDKDFANNSDLRFEAEQALLEQSQREYREKNADFVKHSKERDRLQSIITNDLVMIDNLSKQIEKETDPKKIKMLQLQIGAYGNSYANTKRDLDKHMSTIPKRVSTVKANLDSIKTGGIMTGEKALLARIREGEGTSDKKARKHGYKSGYDTTLGYGKFADDKTKRLTEMTVAEVYQHQKKMKRNKKNRFSTGRRDKNGKMIKLPSSAVGAYQFTEPTLRRLMKKKGYNPKTTKMDAKLQDELALELIKESGGNRYKRGKMSDDKFQNRIAGIWASIATTKGKSAYGQHTGTSSSAIRTAMHQYKNPTKNKRKKPVVEQPQQKPIGEKKDKTNNNRDLLIKLVKNTTPSQSKPQRQLTVNHTTESNSI